jgi:hypothetical protein
MSEKARKMVFYGPVSESLCSREPWYSRMSRVNFGNRGSQAGCGMMIVTFLEFQQLALRAQTREPLTVSVDMSNGPSCDEVSQKPWASCRNHVTNREAPLFQNREARCRAV